MQLSRVWGNQYECKHKYNNKYVCVCVYGCKYNCNNNGLAYVSTCVCVCVWKQNKAVYNIEKEKESA